MNPETVGIATIKGLWEPLKVFGRSASGLHLPETGPAHE